MPVPPCPAPRRRRRGAGLLAACGLLLGLAGGAAAAAEDFYTVRVAVDSRQAAERQAAAEAGLARLVGRMVGAYGGPGADHPAAGVLGTPQRFLTGFQYERLDGDRLAVALRFDREALRRSLGEREVAVWGRRRPSILTWLAVDLGGQRGLLGPADSGARGRVVARLRAGAERRALPLMFPALDLQDRRALAYLDIWGGFEARIREASARYGERPVLAVALRRRGAGAWQGRWLLLAGGEVIAEHETGPAGLEQAVQAGLDAVGRRLTERFAVVPGAHAGEHLRLAVLGIEDEADYLGALRHLEGARGVTRVAIRRVDGDRVTARLTVARSPARVAEALADGGALRPEAPSADGAADGTAGSSSPRVYRWQP